MSLARRVSVETARTRVARGEALLVCAYEDEAKCRKYALPGSIPYATLEQRLDDLDEEQEMILY